VTQKDENKGKILRVKTGYNPNSSSVGSNIPAFLAFAAGAGAVSVIVVNILSTINSKIRGKKDSLNSKSDK